MLLRLIVFVFSLLIFSTSRSLLSQAICIQAVLRVKPIQVLIEQPTSSSMFSLPVWETLTSQLSLSQVPTYLGSFGHFMLKPSVLLTNVYKTTLFSGLH